MRKWILLAVAVSALAPLCAYGQGRQVFDGSWSVVVVCDPSREGDGYRLQFPAIVQGGLLHGQMGTPGRANSLALDGDIQPDGTASIRAQGFTGPSRYNINHEQEGLPYHYTLQTRFVGTQGFGKRLETRPCTASFTRQ